MFQMDLRRAVGLLNNGARSSAPSPPSGASSSASGQSAGQGQGQGAGINWKLLSLALAGFNLQSPHPSNALWQETCRDLSAQLDDPYLRVLFAFLCEVSSPSSSKDFLSIVHNPLLSLADRIAFACSFLPDLEVRTAYSAPFLSSLHSLFYSTLTSPWFLPVPGSHLFFSSDLTLVPFF